MILDMIQIVLLLVCTGLIYHFTSRREPPANGVPQEGALGNLPEPDLHEIREELIAYIDRESRILEFDDFGPDEFIGYSCGYEHRNIWLTIWIGPGLDIVATRLMIDREYRNTFERLKENKNKIEWLFPEEQVNDRQFTSGSQGIGVEKRVDLSQRENWDEISVWVRENLEKLFYVIRIHDAIQESEDDSPTFSGRYRR